LIRIKSHAKINLCLYVLGEREDGYHEIFTVMQTVDLCDELSLSRISESIKIECDDPEVPQNSSNLAHRAAQLVLDEAEVDFGVKIRIKKRIPVGAGLGGGSSNAASVLIGLNRMLNLRFTGEKLHQIAEKIGSDVPFFLYSGQAVARGRGEKIKQIKLPKDYWIILVNPHFKILTPSVYKKIRIDLTKKVKEIKISFNKAEFFALLKEWSNDLEGEVVKTFPQIKEIKDRLREAGAIKAQMSGSGPTVFGIFKKKPEKKEVHRFFKDDWQIFLTRPIIKETKDLKGEYFQVN